VAVNKYGRYEGTSVETVGRITYIVLVQTLNHAQSIKRGLAAISSETWSGPIPFLLFWVSPPLPLLPSFRLPPSPLPLSSIIPTVSSTAGPEVQSRPPTYLLVF